MNVKIVRRLMFGLVIAAGVALSPQTRARAMPQSGTEEPYVLVLLTEEGFVIDNGTDAGAVVDDSRVREAGVAFVLADPETVRCFLAAFYVILGSACLVDGLILGAVAVTLLQRCKAKKDRRRRDLHGVRNAGIQKPRSK